ncbi:MAG TPA: BON domain-containing protein [Steroidobacteraceae bacterium]|nr:BON domain-containing protein [Steroidobacteraceae bacterium]
MKTDADIKRSVEAELRWCPEIDETDIAVKVHGGAVTLTGYVRSIAEKFRAEAAIKNVAGVAAVANDIEVRVLAGASTSDPEIARQAVEALRSDLPLWWQGIRPLVHQGHVALEGAVEWNYQRERAERVIRRLPGVVSVRNSIRIEPKAKPSQIRQKIEAAFHRNAQIDADHVKVETNGAEVTLRGEVRSWAERDEAQRTAWSAPGVVRVHNEIVVRT